MERLMKIFHHHMDSYHHGNTTKHSQLNTKVKFCFKRPSICQRFPLPRSIQLTSVCFKGKFQCPMLIRTMFQTLFHPDKSKIWEHNTKSWTNLILKTGIKYWLLAASIQKYPHQRLPSINALKRLNPHCREMTDWNESHSEVIIYRWKGTCSPLVCLSVCLVFLSLSKLSLLCPLEANQTTALGLSSCLHAIINLSFQYAGPPQAYMVLTQQDHLPGREERNMTHAV